MTRRVVLLSVTVLLISLPACSSDDPEPTSEPADTSHNAAADIVEPADLTVPEPDTAAPEPDTSPPQPDVSDPPDQGPPPVLTCADGLPIRPFATPETPGKHRMEAAGDFTITRLDGKPWTLSEEWTGCDTYIFIPETLSNSSIDPSSVWERDIANLVKASPDNVHYFFVSRAGTDGAADAVTSAMFDRVAAELQTLESDVSDAWWFRLHVAQGRAMTIGGWIAGVMSNGIGAGGFAIDRFQRLRGLGSLADVSRYNTTLANQDAWPWEANIAYAANEAHYYNAEAAHTVALEELDATHGVTEVVLWDGEIIEEFEELEITLPSADDMAGFDTFEIEVHQQCPNPNVPEPGNCGAWDYLAHLSVYEVTEEPLPDGETPPRIELGRFITTYHREAHWVHDVSPMLAHLLAGGTRKLRWEWAPAWNVQPTATRLSLRFSNRNKGASPADTFWLHGGGGFNPEYNPNHPSLEVPIPADATRVELYVVVSGHGADTSQCAEFCNHGHEWTVNGTVFLEDHPTVGNQTGCVQELERQMTPNQWGTWWFGRGGWCPGQPVLPWIVDVTDLVEPGGMATIDYRGLLGGQDPPENAGNINMTSWLVFYR